MCLWWVFASTLFSTARRWRMKQAWRRAEDRYRSTPHLERKGRGAYCFVVGYIAVKDVVVEGYSRKRGACSYIVCMRIVVWYMIRGPWYFGRVFEVMCNVLSISVCPLSCLSPPSSCCVVSCLSEYRRNCLSVSRVFSRVKKRRLNKVWNRK